MNLTVIFSDIGAVFAPLFDEILFGNYAAILELWVLSICLLKLIGITSGDGQKPHLNLSMPNQITKGNWLARKLKNFTENLSGFLLSLEWQAHRGFGGKGSKLPVFPYAGSGDPRPNSVTGNAEDEANPDKNAEKKKKEDADVNKNSDPKENPKESPEGKKSKHAKKGKHQKVNAKKTQGGGES